MTSITFDLNTPSSSSTSPVSQIPGYIPSMKEVSRSDLMLGINRDAQRLRQLNAVAMAPGKQLFMTAFMLWMSGSSLNIFSIMMTGMALWSPIKSLLSINQSFAAFSDLSNSNQQKTASSSVSSGKLTQAKLIFMALNCLGLLMGAYKLGNMGLLPVYSSDWISLLDAN